MKKTSPEAVLGSIFSKSIEKFLRVSSSLYKCFFTKIEVTLVGTAWTFSRVFVGYQANYAIKFHWFDLILSSCL